MSKKILCFGILFLICFSFGCTSQIYYGVGSVKHGSDLQEAFDNCRLKCIETYPDEVNKISPRISECNDRECFCEC